MYTNLPVFVKYQQKYVFYFWGAPYTITIPLRCQVIFVYFNNTLKNTEYDFFWHLSLTIFVNNSKNCKKFSNKIQDLWVFRNFNSKEIIVEEECSPVKYHR